MSAVFSPCYLPHTALGGRESAGWQSGTLLFPLRFPDAERFPQSKIGNWTKEDRRDVRIMDLLPLLSGWCKVSVVFPASNFLRFLSSLKSQGKEPHGQHKHESRETLLTKQCSTPKSATNNPFKNSILSSAKTSFLDIFTFAHLAPRLSKCHSLSKNNSWIERNYLRVKFHDFASIFPT